MMFSLEIGTLVEEFARALVVTGKTLTVTERRYDSEERVRLKTKTLRFHWTTSYSRVLT